MSAALERPLDESQREEAQAVIGWARVALQSGPAWSRIDSAPKDGGPVLGYVRFARGGHVVEMRFDGATGEWVTAPPRRVVLPTIGCRCRSRRSSARSPSFPGRTGAATGCRSPRDRSACGSPTRPKADASLSANDRGAAASRGR
jgi:hypothetical protein